MKNPDLRNENWDRFLPHFKKICQKKKAKRKEFKKEKKEYTPFPPEPQPRKIDLMLDSGEYFANKQDLEKKKKIMEAKKTATKRRMEKEKEYKAPDEDELREMRKKKIIENERGEPIEEIKRKFIKKKISKGE